MAKYGLGPAITKVVEIHPKMREFVYPSFDRYFRSIKNARAEAYRQIMAEKGRSKEIYVYDLSGKEPIQVGFCYSTNINQDMRVVPGSRWVIYQNMNVKAKDAGLWYVNKDGTLGRRRR